MPFTLSIHNLMNIHILFWIKSLTKIIKLKKKKKKKKETNNKLKKDCTLLSAISTYLLRQSWLTVSSLSKVTNPKPTAYKVVDSRRMNQ